MPDLPIKVGVEGREHLRSTKAGIDDISASAEKASKTSAELTKSLDRVRVAGAGAGAGLATGLTPAARDAEQLARKLDEANRKLETMRESAQSSGDIGGKAWNALNTAMTISMLPTFLGQMGTGAAWAGRAAAGGAGFVMGGGAGTLAAVALPAAVAGAAAYGYGKYFMGQAAGYEQQAAALANLTAFETRPRTGGQLRTMEMTERVTGIPGQEQLNLVVGLEGQLEGLGSKFTGVADSSARFAEALKAIGVEARRDQDAFALLAEISEKVFNEPDMQRRAQLVKQMFPGQDVAVILEVLKNDFAGIQARMEQMRTIPPEIARSMTELNNLSLELKRTWQDIGAETSFAWANVKGWAKEQVMKLAPPPEATRWFRERVREFREEYLEPPKPSAQQMERAEYARRAELEFDQRRFMAVVGPAGARAMELAAKEREYQAKVAEIESQIGRRRTPVGAVGQALEYLTGEQEREEQRIRELRIRAQNLKSEIELGRSEQGARAGMFQYVLGGPTFQEDLALRGALSARSAQLLQRRIALRQLEGKPEEEVGSGVWMTPAEQRRKEFAAEDRLLYFRLQRAERAQPVQAQIAERMLRMTPATQIADIRFAYRTQRALEEENLAALGKEAEDVDRRQTALRVQELKAQEQREVAAAELREKQKVYAFELEKLGQVRSIRQQIIALEARPDQRSQLEAYKASYEEALKSVVAISAELEKQKQSQTDIAIFRERGRIGATATYLFQLEGQRQQRVEQRRQFGIAEREFNTGLEAQRARALARPGERIEVEIQLAEKLKKVYSEIRRPGDDSEHAIRLLRLRQGLLQTVENETIQRAMAERDIRDRTWSREEQHRLRMLDLGGQQFDLAKQYYDFAIEAATREFTLTRDQARLAEQIGDAKMQREQQLAALQARQIDNVKQQAAQLYAALRIAGPSGLGGFVRGQIDVMGQQIFANVAGMLFRTIQPRLGGIFGGQTRQGERGQEYTIRGELLRGTWFGQTPKAEGLAATEISRQARVEAERIAASVGGLKPSLEKQAEQARALADALKQETDGLISVNQTELDLIAAIEALDNTLQKMLGQPIAPKLKPELPQEIPAFLKKPPTLPEIPGPRTMETPTGEGRIATDFLNRPAPTTVAAPEPRLLLRDAVSALVADRAIREIQPPVLPASRPVLPALPALESLIRPVLPVLPALELHPATKAKPFVVPEPPVLREPVEVPDFLKQQPAREIPVRPREPIRIVEEAPSEPAPTLSPAPYRLPLPAPPYTARLEPPEIPDFLKEAPAPYELPEWPGKRLPPYEPMPARSREPVQLPLLREPLQIPEFLRIQPAAIAPAHREIPEPPVLHEPFQVPEFMRALAGLLPVPEPKEIPVAQAALRTTPLPAPPVVQNAVQIPPYLNVPPAPVGDGGQVKAATDALAASMAGQKASLDSGTAASRDLSVQVQQEIQTLVAVRQTDQELIWAIQTLTQSIQAMAASGPAGGGAAPGIIQTANQVFQGAKWPSGYGGEWTDVSDVEASRAAEPGVRVVGAIERPAGDSSAARRALLGTLGTVLAGAQAVGTGTVSGITSGALALGSAIVNRMDAGTTGRSTNRTMESPSGEGPIATGTTTGPQPTPGQRAMGVAAGAAIAGTSIYAGAKEGGGRGLMTGASGTLIGVGSMIPGPVGTVMMISGMVLGAVRSFMGDPKKERYEDIQKWLEKSVFKPPKPVEITIDIGGRQVDYGARGEIRIFGPERRQPTPIPRDTAAAAEEARKAHEAESWRDYTGWGQMRKQQEAQQGTNVMDAWQTYQQPNKPSPVPAKDLPQVTSFPIPIPPGTGRRAFGQPLMIQGPLVTVNAMDAASFLSRKNDIATATREALIGGHALASEMRRIART